MSTTLTPPPNEGEEKHRSRSTGSAPARLATGSEPSPDLTELLDELYEQMDCAIERLNVDLATIWELHIRLARRCQHIANHLTRDLEY